MASPDAAEPAVAAAQDTGATGAVGAGESEAEAPAPAVMPEPDSVAGADESLAHVERKPSLDAGASREVGELVSVSEAMKHIKPREGGGERATPGVPEKKVKARTKKTLLFSLSQTLPTTTTTTTPDDAATLQTLGGHWQLDRTRFHTKPMRKLPRDTYVHPTAIKGARAVVEASRGGGDGHAHVGGLVRGRGSHASTRGPDGGRRVDKHVWPA